MRSSYLLVCFFAIFGSVHLSPVGDKDMDYQDDVGSTKPEEFNVELGHKVVLPCEFRSDAIMEWKRYTDASSTLEELTYDDDAIIQRFQLDNTDKKYNLIIPEVQYEDVGKYTCYLVKEASTEIVTHQINVYRKATITKISPEKHAIVDLSGSVALSCKATGFPAPKITWRKEGKNSHSTKILHEGSILSLRAVNYTDSGNYVCQAENNQGEPDIKSVRVSVKGPPVVEVKSPKGPSGDMQDSELVCAIHSYERPSVKWLKDGNEINNEMKENIKVFNKDPHHYILRFSPVTVSDFGTYECFAENSAGTDSKKVELTGKPSKPLKMTVSASVDQGKPIASWKVISYFPIIEYKLKYKRQEDNEWTEVTLQADQGTGGVYHPHHSFSDLKQGTYHAVLKAQNKFGWSEESDRVPITGAISPRLAQAGVFLQESQSSMAAKERVSVLSVFIFSILMARWLQ